MGPFRKVGDAFEIRIEQSRVVILGVGAVLLVALVALFMLFGGSVPV